MSHKRKSSKKRHGRYKSGRDSRWYLKKVAGGRRNDSPENSLIGTLAVNKIRFVRLGTDDLVVESDYDPRGVLIKGRTLDPDKDYNPGNMVQYRIFNETSQFLLGEIVPEKTEAVEIIGSSQKILSLQKSKDSHKLKTTEPARYVSPMRKFGTVWPLEKGAACAGTLVGYTPIGDLVVKYATLEPLVIVTNDETDGSGWLSKRKEYTVGTRIPFALLKKTKKDEKTGKSKAYGLILEF